MSTTELPPQNHPEQKAGEVFLCNCYGGEHDEYYVIDYQIKRAGLIAYDPAGQVLMHHFPVFVLRAEYNLRHQEVKIGQ
jgi:hypothetical protein